MKKIRHITYLLITIFLTTGLGAQTQLSTVPIYDPVEKNAEFGEIIRIAAIARDLPYLSFQATTIVSDSANVTAPADTMQGTFRLSGSRYWAMLDSVEFVQGYKYNLALYHTEQLIAVGKPALGPPAMQLDVLDSAFQQAHVDSMTVVEIDSTNRLLTIAFNSEAPYSGYELQYNKFTYQLNSITYFLKNGYERTDGTSVTAKLTTTFSNYSQAEFSRDYFLEEKYVYKNTQGFQPAAQYATYQIITTADDL